MTGLTSLKSTLGDNGLQVLGHCPSTLDEPGATILLIGPDEPAFWPIFAQSPEASGAVTDPLDRWSHRVLTAIAADHQAQTLFPFGGPPYQPFHTWALRSGRFWASPIGFLVHDQAGLFVSFRSALAVPYAMPATQGTQPCLSCTNQPCKTACPVDAFNDGYDVAACKTHLHSPDADCMSQGCRARRACPVGQGSRLPAQAQFHMEAFL